MNCIRECHISKEDRSTGECFIAVSGRIFTFQVQNSRMKEKKKKEKKKEKRKKEKTHIHTIY